MNEHWLIIGGGPSGHMGFGIGHHITATTNTGLVTCHDAGVVPDWIFISCPIAIEKFKRQAMKFRARGARIVSVDHKKSKRALVRQGIGPADVMIQFPPAPDGPYDNQYRPGEWTKCRFSGSMLIQFVLNLHRPQRITMAGFDGYPIDWVDPLASPMLGPFMQSALAATAGMVEWEWVTRPNYEIPGATVIGGDVMQPQPL